MYKNKHTKHALHVKQFGNDYMIQARHKPLRRFSNHEDVRPWDRSSMGFFFYYLRL